MACRADRAVSFFGAVGFRGQTAEFWTFLRQGDVAANAGPPTVCTGSSAFVLILATYLVSLLFSTDFAD